MIKFYNKVMFSSRLESYFLENEKKVNRLISKLLPLFCIVGPIIFLCNKLGIFSTADLIKYFPKRYTELRERQPLKNV